MQKHSAVHTSNLLMGALSAPDLARLQSHLKPVTLELRKELEKPNKPIQTIYFINSGFASVVAVQSGPTQIEIGLIGNEGMTGSSVLMGDGQSPHSTYMQASGSGESMTANELRNAVSESATLHRTLLKYAQSFMVQTAQTALTNGRARLPERLARWILMAQDRIGGDVITLTHEFLGLMLAVRRAGVTEAIHDLQNRNLIKARRGEILVLNRSGLERIAGEFYGLPEREYRRLIG